MEHAVNVNANARTAKDPLVGARRSRRIRVLARILD